MPRHLPQSSVSRERHVNIIARRKYADCGCLVHITCTVIDRENKRIQFMNGCADVGSCAYGGIDRNLVVAIRDMHISESRIKLDVFSTDAGHENSRGFGNLLIVLG